MKKYRVGIPFPVWVYVTVTAKDAEQAEDLAFQEAALNSYVGNSGSDKLIGVSESNMSVEAGDVPIEADGFDISIEEL